MKKFITFTYIIWLFLCVPMFVVSLFVTPFMLWQGWEGYTTWFGNRKYGRYGNTAYPASNFWQSFVFLVIRNPVSNFGKEVISYKVSQPVISEGKLDITDGAPGIEGQYFIRSGWRWEVRMVYKTFPGKCFEGRWGWKLNDKSMGDECTFVCRANPFKKFG